ncbi:MAG: hypothetical protein KAX38_00490, partial [Candidatus Krumholzibacteria bacterium]|nr:hypothetical protein [Candidatus Krumholzibacteria bacterium]
MLNRRSISLLICILVPFVIGVGCSRYKPRPIDISMGEYYEDEEYQKLSKKDREIYCRALEKELDTLHTRSEKALSELNNNNENIKIFTKDLRNAEREYANLSAHVDELTKQLQELAILPGTWVLQYGECLWTLASYEDIYGDPLKWPRLWRGNSELIEDPEWVLAGWELKIPRDWPKKHVVIEDEWLAKIAGYWEIYD